ISPSGEIAEKSCKILGRDIDEIIAAVEAEASQPIRVQHGGTRIGYARPHHARTRRCRVVHSTRDPSARKYASSGTTGQARMGKWSPAMLSNSCTPTPSNWSPPTLDATVEPTTSR